MEDKGASEGTPDPEAERLREIDEAIARARREATVAGPDDEAFGLKLREIETRAKAARHKSEPVTAPGAVSETSKAAYRDAGIAIAVAYNVVGVTLGGWIIGFLVDSSAKTTPLGQAIGALVGGIAGVTSAIIVVLRSDKKGPK